MPLIILTGHPCTGKTRFANRLKDELVHLYQADRVVLINEENLHLSKKEMFQG
jgi:tRNA uridine 5-carbamoylmethylation protein Kti12